MAMIAACPDEYVTVAENLADIARPIAQRYFRTDIAIESKADASPVTLADREIEAAMRVFLHDSVPDHGIIGEEMGGDPEHDGPLWILDPIDGTKAFATGTPVFGTLIGLAMEKQFALGVIDQPIANERWLGAAGRATTFNGALACVSGCTDLKAARLYTTAPEYFTSPVAFEAFARVREQVFFTRYGADCYAFGLLASGHVDVIVEATLNLWDVAALVPVVEGAGGIITDWRGEPLTTDFEGHVVASCGGAIHDSVLALINA
jgi:inositol-phosphate phosphatase/L-galactose 1-phosphate phosphatase/histidinol-phosphatase